MDSTDARTVLIIEAGFLKSRHGKPVHGVELFRFYLIEQLLDRGHSITVYFDPAWRRTVRDRFGSKDQRTARGLTCRFTPPLFGTVSNATHAVLHAKVVDRAFDVVIFGNVCRGLIPAIRIAEILRLGNRMLGFAHRRAVPAAVRTAVRSQLPIIAVSEFVAGRFRDNGHTDVSVYYGLPNADVFHPPETQCKDDGLVHFCLLGRLPNISKGMPKALEAFQLLPEDVRERARLHLVAFIESTKIDIPGVIAHNWVDSGNVPVLLRDMDVMLALSSNETFSQAIVQGMLTGLPIIATSLPVYVEKLDTNGGFVADEPAAIAEHMATLIRDDGLRVQMGAIGRKAALERYVWDTDEFIDRFLFPRQSRS